MKRYTISLIQEEADCWRADLLQGEAFLGYGLGATPAQAVGYLFPDGPQ